MEIALWIVASIVAAFYLMAGGMKTFKTVDFVEKAPWAKRMGVPLVRVVGILELLGAVGIVLPQLTGIGAPALTIIAAGCLALVQIVAIGIHIAEKSLGSLPINVAMVILPLFVMIGRLFWV
ncbi:DoxX family protein [Glaciihabitans arcticus]|uniref:DoxX family protein n=1 Tax=Glaciihabitans arcticus TaxID=2668039 RepID=A0A4Q9GTX7_9MICO|nr:DoxX family protein [Glaciihabitans arcticus]TBN58181.1 DoxX family protein [Glaciihabitans arcticus]